MRIIIRKIWLSMIVSLAPIAGALAQDGESPIDTGATAWMLTSTALVLLMVPGLAMFYGGLVRTKNVIGTMMHSFAAMGIMTVLWAVCGYAMAFGPNVLGGWFGWDSNLLFLDALLAEDSVVGSVPGFVFSMFQGKFAIITPALIAGAFAERVRFKAYCLFIAAWGLLIYNPLCHWVWYGSGDENIAGGFLFDLGAIDFAGGTVVHISAGVSGLVAALYLGARKGHPHAPMRPNNLVMTLIGAGLLWVGWFGFNAGSSVESGYLTARALAVTQIAAAAGALAWMIIEGVHQGKATGLGFASGVLAGLVAITPAAGAVGPVGALVLGVAATTLCYLGIMLKNKLGYDDTLDAFGIHGIGGIVGAIFLVFFLLDKEKNVAEQLGVQALAVVIAIAYAAIGTLVILFILDKVISIRSKEEAEMKGLDNAYHGERGYGMINPN